MSEEMVFAITGFMFASYVLVNNDDTVAVLTSYISAFIMTVALVSPVLYFLNHANTKEPGQHNTPKTINTIEAASVDLGSKSDSLIRVAPTVENNYLASLFLEELEESGRVTDTLKNKILSLFDNVEEVGRVEINGSNGSMSNTKVQLTIKTYDEETDELMKVFVINGIAE